MELQTEDGVKFYKTPDAILQRQLEVYDEVAKGKPPTIHCSRRSSTRRSPSRAGRRGGNRTTWSAARMAFDHYFGENAAATRSETQARSGKAQSGVRQMVLRRAQTALAAIDCTHEASNAFCTWSTASVRGSARPRHG